MGRRGKGSRGGSEGRVRGRVRERVQGGRSGRGGAGGGRKRGSSFDVADIEGYARRLSGGGAGASALAGAASGLAGGGLASRFLGGTQGSDEDFRAEVLERLSLMEDRLQRLEGQVDEILTGGTQGDPTEPGSVNEPGGNP